MSEKSIEELREEASPGERADGKHQTPDLVEDLADQLVAIDNGDSSGQVAIRDDPPVALANVLDDREEDYEDLVATVEAEIGSTPNLEEGTKAYLVALLARAGLEAYAPEYADAMSEAIGEYAQRTM